jgi:chromosomal replication initiation ATPase DnaA
VTQESLSPDADQVKNLKRRLAHLDQLGLLGDINKFCIDGNVLLEDVFGTRRHAHVVRVRHRIWLWFHEERRWSYPSIGALFDRDHTSVMHGAKMAARDLGLPTPAGRTRRAA